MIIPEYYEWPRDLPRALEILRQHFRRVAIHHHLSEADADDFVAELIFDIYSGAQGGTLVFLGWGAFYKYADKAFMWALPKTIKKIGKSPESLIADPPTNRLGEEAYRAEIEDLLSCLNGPLREVARMYYFDGMTAREIAEKLQIAESSAYRSIKKAEEQLQSRYS